MILQYRLSGTRFLFRIFRVSKNISLALVFGILLVWPSHPLGNLKFPSLCSSTHLLYAVSLRISGPSLLYHRLLPVGGKCRESYARLHFWSCTVAFHSRFLLPLQSSHLGRRICFTGASTIGFSWVSRLAACIFLDCGREAELFSPLPVVWGLGLSPFPRKIRLVSMPTPFADLREQLDWVGWLVDSALRRKSSIWPLPPLSSSRIHIISWSSLTLRLIPLLMNLWNEGCGVRHCLYPLPVHLVPSVLSSCSICLESCLLLILLYLGR